MQLVLVSFGKMHILHNYALYIYFEFSVTQWANNVHLQKNPDHLKRKFILGNMHNLHIHAELCTFFWYSLDQYLPPPKGIRILSALVFCLSFDNTNTTHQTQHISPYILIQEKGPAIVKRFDFNTSHLPRSAPLIPASCPLLPIFPRAAWEDKNIHQII